MTESAILILAGLLLVITVIWILRSRAGKTRHVDTSVTAVGAAVEAVRDTVEEVVETVQESLTTEVKASGAREDDVAAETSNAAAIMAASGAVAGVPTFTEIGVPAAAGAPDNLRLIKGLGPKLNTTLIGLGITRYDQIAAWTADDIAKVDAHLGTFKGRIARDNWVEQAKYLARGDTAGFEAKFGKIDGAAG